MIVTHLQASGLYTCDTPTGFGREAGLYLDKDSDILEMRQTLNKIGVVRYATRTLCSMPLKPGTDLSWIGQRTIEEGEQWVEAYQRDRAKEVDSLAWMTRYAPYYLISPWFLEEVGAPDYLMGYFHKVPAHWEK